MKLEPLIYRSPQHPGKWTAVVRVDGKPQRLGSRFKSPDAANNSVVEFLKLKRRNAAEARVDFPADKLERLLTDVEAAPSPR